MNFSIDKLDTISLHLMITTADIMTTEEEDSSNLPLFLPFRRFTGEFAVSILIHWIEH